LLAIREQWQLSYRRKKFRVSHFDSHLKAAKHFVADKVQFVACGTTGSFARLYERVPHQPTKESGSWVSKH